jgi:vacuolar-type H+-ATPase subunit I/STV1
MSSRAASRVEVWIWVLIYAGLALLGLGLAVQRGDAPLGWTIAAIGIALAVVGAVLIWVRSRMKSG